MVFHLTVVSDSAALESEWADRLRRVLVGLADVNVEAASRTGTHGQIIFVDVAMKGFSEALSRLDRRGRAVFLILDERANAEDVPVSLMEEKVDDVLVFPFRRLEVLSKIRHYQQILMWDEVARLNASFSGLIEQLHDDLKLAERLQKNRLPARFPEIKGFRALSRYLAGMRSGGDHFDLADAADGGSLSLVLSDSSSYGLSSAVLSVLMRVAMKLSSGEARACLDTVKKIQEELMLVLGERDRLSLFYGVVSRKDYRMRYSNIGTSCAFYAGPGAKFCELPSQGEPITRASGLISRGEAEIVLEPDGRLVLISDGFVEAVGGGVETTRLLDQFRTEEPADSLNELVFKVKAKLESADDMPAQDCTAIILDVNSRVLRLTR
jgi:serine phosphatase RsbU (regulator of sigma subunit)